MAWLALGKIPLSKREIALVIIEALQFVLVVVDLGIMISAAEGMKAALHFGSIPGKLEYNIFAAVLSFVALPIFLVLDVTKPKFWFFTHRVTDARYGQVDNALAWRTLQHSPWIRVGITGLLSAFWIGAVVSSVYTCSDLCPSTTWEGVLAFAGLCCDCTPSASTLIQCPVGGEGTYQYIEQKTNRYEITQGLDATILVLHLISAGLWLSFLWKDASTASWFYPERDGRRTAPDDRRSSIGQISQVIRL